MNNPIKKLLGACAVAAAVAMAPQVAAQSFGVQINGATCIDNTACDTNSTVGVINFNAVTPGFNATINIGSTNTPGGPAFSFLDLAFVVFAGPTIAPGTVIEFLASATGFTFPVAGSPSIMDSQLNGNGSPGSGATGQAWLDFTNTLFGEQGITTGLQGLNTQNSVAFTSQTPYSLTQHLYLTVGPNGIVTGDFLTQVVPEPAPLALIGIALAGLAFARRRDRS